MKQDKVFLNLDKEILWGGFGVLLIIFSIIISYKSKDSSVSCSGGNSERLYDQLLNIDELNTKGALFEVNIPSTNIGVKTNEDYFNLGITSFNEKTSSYLVEGDKITLYEDFSRATYFLCLKQKERDTLIELRFKIPQVKSIDFIGKGKNGYFYFTVGYDLFELGNKYNNCTKLLIRSDGVIMVSDY